ncbi:MAG: hypothetical protein AAF788_00130 [Pseudomonadota bacterium]
MTTPAAIFEQGLTAKGTSLVSPDELEASLDFLRERRVFVQSIEAFALRGELQALTLEFSILGLDGDRDWEKHHDVGRSYELVLEKIAGAREYKEPIVFQVWLDDAPTP